jgi:hypothetical protein
MASEMLLVDIGADLPPVASVDDIISYLEKKKENR